MHDARPPHTLSPARTTPKKRSLSLLGLTSLALLGACDGTVTGTGIEAVDGTAEKAALGQQAFRDATFGTEAFWTEAVGLGAGMSGENFTVRRALELGMQIDVAKLPGTSGSAGFLGEDRGDTTTLDSPEYFERALARSAIIGLVGNDANGNGRIDHAAGETVGISCALCHSVTDGSSYDGGDDGLPGTIGVPIDGPAPRSLDLGALFASASRSRALYPFLPLSLAGLGGEPIARTDAVLREDATEAEVDAVLLDPLAFPIGQWDLTPDGIGAPVCLPPVFDIRPAGQYGAAGEFNSLLDAINFHATVGLDPTTLLAVDGAVFLNGVAPGAGSELTNEYEDVLANAGVLTPAGGFPYVDAEAPGASGASSSPAGLRLNETTLRNISIFLGTLRAPLAPEGDAAAIARGETTYLANCASCHGAVRGASALDPTPITALYQNYAPTTLFARGFPYTDMLDDRLTTYDDRFVVFDRLFEGAQIPAAPRSIATPQVTGLHLLGRLLHDGSVASVESLLDSARGPAAPHAVYVADDETGDLIEFLTRR